MFKYNNNHIFTGYLKQLLSSFNLPACKIYTKEFAEYLAEHGEEDPRVLKSFDNINSDRLAVRIHYLKNNELCNYFCNTSTRQILNNASWRKSTDVYYSEDKFVPGLTRRLNSPGIIYDTKTHEYLGDYLRFIRDYYNINLMSMYNCFTDKIYNNVYFKFLLNPKAPKNKQIEVHFDAQEPEYRLYALPVKLFSEYTIAIDCDQGVEMFCGLYSTSLDMSSKSEDLAARTYQRVHKAIFKQPFLYSKLSKEFWSDDTDLVKNENGDKIGIHTDAFTRWDLTCHERDLKLFIKVPVSCRSSITVLEGDFRNYNDCIYAPNDDTNRLTYAANHTILNFNTRDNIDLNNYDFKPISKLQLLEFNTGESYPFADRLVEYLVGSAITPIDNIPDNIKRVQKVMNLNGYYFMIDGLWENKMKNIIYDYMMSSGPVEVITVGDDIDLDPNGVGMRIANPKEYLYKTKQVIVDRRQGVHRILGHTSRSTIYDVLGYVDKDAEKWYASWIKQGNVAIVNDTISNVDIYNGLYDI